jgi:HEAT repeat protein
LRKALLLLVALAACTSDPKHEPVPPPRNDPPTAGAPSSSEKTSPPKGAEPRQISSDDNSARAAAKAWERGRISLVVDLIAKSKSFDRGFEAALLFIPEMRDGVTTALIEQAASRESRSSDRCIEALGAMARLRLIPDGQRKTAIDTVTKRVRTETAAGAWSASIYALGALVGHDAGQDVQEALGRAVDERCAPAVRACAEVLGDLQFHEAGPALVLALNRADDHYAMRTLMRALGRLGGKDATRRLVDALGLSDAADREAAASALGEAGGDEAAVALRGTIERRDEEPTVRRAAIAGLERMGGDAAVKALRTCLEDLASNREESWVAIKRDLSETLERVQKK